MSQSWAITMGAVQYGFAPFYAMQIEGVPTLLMEYAGDAIAPSGYAIEGGHATTPSARNAGLIVDRSPRVGPVLDDKRHMPSAQDLEVRLFDTTAVRALLSRPTRYTTMTADITASGTTMTVDSTAGWSSVTKLHFGTSCAAYSGALWTQFLSLSRTTYGRARSYKAGTIVTDKPYIWRGRRVTLWVVLLDPTGRYVQGADILSNATAVFQGEIVKRPRRDGAEWVLQARDQVGRLRDPIGAAASGQAVWTLEDDSAVLIDANTVVSLKVQESPGVTLADVQVQPFAGLTGPIRRSRMRELIASTLDTAMTDARTGTPFWKAIPIANDSGGTKRRWQLIVPVTSSAPFVECRMSMTGAQWMTYFFKVTPMAGTWKVGTSGTLNAECPLWQDSTVNSATLAVVLDNVVPAQLPTSGWVVLEGEGRADYRKYLSYSTDAADARKVHLALDPDSAMTGADVQQLAKGEEEGQLAEVSARFLWRDSGSMPDILRRAIVSTGDAVNGAYDTLPKGQGLGLPSIDATSFATAFDEAFKDLTFAPSVDSGSTLESIFAGILRLSQRAITSRRASDGSAINIAACYVGSADSGVPVATITDAMLVSTNGRRSLRVMRTFSGPQALEVRCRAVDSETGSPREASILLRDPHLVDWAGEQWDLDVVGIDRSALLTPAIGWATSWFRGGENRQVLELDVDMTVDAQPGDIVSLSLTDPQVWDYATGAPGVSGFARVLGVQFSLQRFTQTLTVAVDGVFSSGPMAPSMTISAVNGVATSPTSIDVPSSWLALLTQAKGSASTWKVLAYLPGQDSGRAEYTVSTISSPGGGVARLTVTASPSSPTVTLTTSHRLTWPVVANGTSTQNKHLNNTDRVQWS